MHVFMTPDLREIMCKKPKTTQIKQQWRLPINQIKDAIWDYKDKKKFDASVFAKAGGLFRKSIFS